MLFQLVHERFHNLSYPCLVFDSMYHIIKGCTQHKYCQGGLNTHINTHNTCMQHNSQAHTHAHTLSHTHDVCTRTCRYTHAHTYMPWQLLYSNMPRDTSTFALHHFIFQIDLFRLKCQLVVKLTTIHLVNSNPPLRPLWGYPCCKCIMSRNIQNFTHSRLAVNLSMPRAYLYT